jgi:hypothetical protein
VERDVVGEVELADVGSDDLLIGEIGGIVVLDGPQDAIERFRSLHPALDRATPMPNVGLVASAAGQLGGLLARPDTTKRLFELDDVGMEMFERAGLAASKKGGDWLRLFGHGDDGIMAQGSLRPVGMPYQDVLSAQLALTTVALTAAIKQVQEAVERVEQKLDNLNDLVTSMLVGGVLGAHEALARRIEQSLLVGWIADADWGSIHGVGVEVEQQIATLRTFVRKRLRAAVGEGSGVKGRRDALDHVNQVAEVLGLLAIAQHSLFLFQAARLQRIRATEPGHLAAAIEEAHQLLEQHAADDRELLEQCRTIVAERLEVDPLELVRYLSARDLVRLAGETDASLDWFAAQRALAYEPLPSSILPTLGEAYDEVKSIGATVSDGARAAVDVARARFRHRDDDPDPV